MHELKVQERESIGSLWKEGLSAGRIAREMGCNRKTVSCYIRLEAAPKPATLTPGDCVGSDAKPATPTAGKEAVAVATACEAARRNLSLCGAWKAETEAGLEQGLTAKRIHEDLVARAGVCRRLCKR